MEHLEREVQIADQEAPATVSPPGLSEAESSGQRALNEELGEAQLTPVVMSLIERLMAGTEPFGRELKAWEVKAFSPVHINVCTLRAAGFKGVEIARICSLDSSRVSQILTHPYGVKLVGALVPRNSVRVLDIRTRLEEYAGDLLDRVYGQAMIDEDLEKVQKVTFGMLDRAGYNPKPAVQSEKPSGELNDSTFRRLARALDESSQVDREVMPTWVPRRPPEEGSLPADDVLGSSPRRLVAGESSGEADSSPLTAAGGSR